MDALEWVELQTLAAEISHTRSRLVQARSRKDHRLARMLEEEILAAERRRDLLVAHITDQFADAQHGGAQPAQSESAASPDEAEDAAPPPQAAEPERPSAAAAEPERPSAAAAEPEQPSAAAPEPDATGEPAATASAPEADTLKGGVVVWDQLTPGDIERAKQELGVRRSEMLARHAEELKGLDATQAELDTLDRAIEAFARKFKLRDGEDGVVQLDGRRDTRLQAAAGQA
jgi:hypothetical protein